MIFQRFSVYTFARHRVRAKAGLLNSIYQRKHAACGVVLVLVVAVSSLFAQSTVAPLTRLTAPIDNHHRVLLPGSHPPRALPGNDAGAVAPSTALQGISLIFSRTAAQENDLQTLLAAQQNPASPLYHQWLTPEQFAARFGVSDADIASTEAWLQQQGFTVDGVSRSRNRLFFSGTAAQVASAFGAEIHRYTVDGESHFAPNGDLTLPAALSGIIASVNNLSSFRPRPNVRLRTAQPEFTSNTSGRHYFSPRDIATAYDINAAYSAGYTGAGQSMAIVGQSAIVTTDITNFQTAAGLAAQAPTLVLVPSSGTSTVVSGDESESDLDLEYSGGIAKGATVYFVYTGKGSGNYDVSDALNYAIEQKIAPVISISYGFCEGANSASFLTAENSYLAQAASQGQTVIASSGDTGSSGCYGFSGISTATAESLQVNWPASSQYVTAVGGTEISSADDLSSTYWSSANGSDVISSVLSYIPEIAWNDGYYNNGSTVTLSATGGGTSALFPRPSWQTGVTGIGSGSFRLVPDVALYSSSSYPGYLYCSSDTNATGVSGSCSNGFRNSSNTLTVAGGTSFAAPIFAGMVAIINQAKSSTGQGVLGNTLYSLAANAGTYASAFHDITSGTNECPAASGVCTTATENSYSTGTGYDEVTGLGSVDFNNLLNAWTGSVSTTSFTVSAPDLTVTQGSSGSTTVTVTPSGGYAGTVNWTAVSSPTLSNACFKIASVAVSSTAAVTTTLTISTSASSCASNSLTLGSGTSAAASQPPALSHRPSQGFGVALAALVVLGFFRRRARRVRPLLACVFLGVLALAATGCGGGGSVSSASTTTSTYATKGTYTITLTGKDATNSALTASTTFKLTIN